MMSNDIEQTAAALYDGGWRAVDKEELRSEYNLTEDEAEKICQLLASYEGPHPLTLTPDDVATGRAQVVHCPDCGQMEIWTTDEAQDHGYCRTLQPYPVKDCPHC